MYSKRAVDEPLDMCWVVVAGCWKAEAEAAKMAPATMAVFIVESGKQVGGNARSRKK